ncbi:hypothetical protein SARC_05972 [Sphaeroforma arctica JP610]|uniref:Ketoreductase domain-containing protein n=1 Tax=Sphaeroforma arctica JP610 TaxID=667725 RepID=A0A0L0FY08_9EUKA|nr:hypothetical protein SARC_05972 [Sphaeroforma arctica JP610]KNC81715.1 hypothetical protein SARC_05972 [Sphaeroforma arctica JP610]|eukprot:XP_014155617.1 hypothetical protein SARC_05972 [Sphaeroforma arctica JP610]
MALSGLAQRVVVVAGATGGIGRAISELYVREGCKVALLGRTEKTLVELQSHLLELANKEHAENDKQLSAVYVATCDVTDSPSVKKAVTDIIANIGAPDILVNAAGVAEDGLLLRSSDKSIQNNINTNLIGPMVTSRAVLPPMLRKGGCIINIGSVVGTHGNVGQCAYSAAKAGLVGFTKSLSKEVGSRGIRVNLINPGYIETPMTAHIPQEKIDKIIQNTTLGRLGTTDDIVQAVRFVSTCTFITGQVLHVDGGLVL